jgi:hypothetical protein
VTAALIRVASWLVPRLAREEWLAEWRGELHHVSRVDRARAWTFCFGAFRDALWIRRNDERARPALLDSPLQTLALLAGLAVAGALASPAPELPEDVVAIRPHGRVKTVTYEQYRAISERLPDGILAATFYRQLSDGSVIATRGVHEVLRGRALPGNAGPYTAVDDIGPGDGHLLARVAVPQRSPWRHINIYLPGSGRQHLDCVPLAPRAPVPGILLLFAIAALILPTFAAITDGVSGHGLWRPWIFFVAKLALALTGALCAMRIFGALIAPFMLVHGLLIGIVFAIRWSFADQRRRCPVCLRKLATPVSFGCLGHTLLDWHGAEYICPQGHGLLQVSATPASPYASHQWLRL